MNEQLKEDIRKAIDIYKKRDWEYLYSVNIYEPTISHHIAVYLESLFYDYDVDCEYNRHLTEDKKLHDCKVRPDIIIHKRGNNNNNLVVFEIKKCGTKSKKGRDDIKKLESCISDGLSYKLGVFIGILKNKINICWVENINGGIKKTDEQI